MYVYQYPRPAFTVDAIVLGGRPGHYKLLLIKRGKEPYAGFWALPGGFLDMEETLEEGCLRELREETGLILSGVHQFRVFDAIHRDPRERTLSAVLYAIIPETLPVRGGDDAGQAGWFSLQDLPILAFDHTEIWRQFSETILSTLSG